MPSTITVQEAHDSTPERYHKFIQVIKGNPYMRVDGRIAMANDEAIQHSATIDIVTRFFDVADTTICQATVRTVRGSATGHAIVNFGGRGVDATNPIENAETSAIGRALGFMGYGLTGTGIASAEEVEGAIEQQSQPKRKAGLVAAWDADKQEMDIYQPVDDIPEPSGPPMSDKQRGFLLAKMGELGIIDGHKRELIDAVAPNKTEASTYLDEMVQVERIPDGLFLPYIKRLRAEHEVSQKAIQEYCKEWFNPEGSPQGLHGDEQRSLISWLAIKDNPYSDIDGFDDWLVGAGVSGDRLQTMTEDEIRTSVAAWIKRNA